MRHLLIMLSLLVMALLPAHAADGGMSSLNQGIGKVEILKPVAVSFSAIPGRPVVAANGLLVRVQSYDCRACRRTCVRDYKWDCDGSYGWCRRKFTQCMRVCWEDECR